MKKRPAGLRPDLGSKKNAPAVEIRVLGSPTAGCDEPPVLYASVPWTDLKIGRSERHIVKIRVLRALRNRAARLTGSVTETARAGEASDMELTADTLGRPIAIVGTTPGPPVSFAHCPGRTWGALSLGASPIGIDAAFPDEFTGPYPFDRAFHPEEFSAALERSQGEREPAAALLWSIKESAVKALGYGFRLLDPLDLTVRFERETVDRQAFSAVLSQAALTRLSMETIVPVVGFSFRERYFRVSLAEVNPSAAGALR
jgi:phosphopantetheinyl transferase